MIAVAALYALALQAILASALVAVQPGLPHILCAPDTASPAGDPAKAPSGHSHLDCCTAAHGSGASPVHAPESTLLTWAVRRTVGVSWRPEVTARPRAPPGISASARAPPVL